MSNSNYTTKTTSALTGAVNFILICGFAVFVFTVLQGSGA